MPVRSQSLTCRLSSAQICFGLSQIFCRPSVSILPQNKTQNCEHRLRNCSLDWPSLSNTISQLIQRRQRSPRQSCSVLEVRAISSTQISCLVKCWLEWNWSSSGRDSNKLPITVAWQQLHTCLGGEQMRKITSVIKVKFDHQQHIS